MFKAVVVVVVVGITVSVAAERGGKVCTHTALAKPDAVALLRQARANDRDITDYAPILEWFKNATADHPNACLQCLHDAVVGGETQLAAACAANPAQCPSAMSRLANVIISTCVHAEVDTNVLTGITQIRSTLSHRNSVNRYDLVAESRFPAGRFPVDDAVWISADMSRCILTTDRKRLPYVDDVVSCIGFSEDRVYPGLSENIKHFTNAINAVVLACMDSGICPAVSVDNVLSAQSLDCQQCLKTHVDAEVAKFIPITEMYPSMHPSCTEAESGVALAFAESHLLTCAGLVSPALGSTGYTGCTRGLSMLRLDNVSKVCSRCVGDASAAIVTKCTFECSLDNSEACTQCIAEIAAGTLSECNAKGETIDYKTLEARKLWTKPTLLSIISAWL